MAYQSLELTHFRSHNHLSLNFSDGVNVIIGPNGSGKTNLLEALYLVSTGTAFRGRDQMFVEYQHKQALIKTTKDKQERALKLTQKDDKGFIKEFTINDHKIYRLNNQQKVPVCLFEPNHLQVVYGGPELRRSLLDQFLTQTSPAYNKALNNYKRALLQRNNLLKSEREVLDDELFIWNVHLSEHGGTIVNFRRDWIEYFNQHASKTYSDLSSSKEKLQATYIYSDQQQEYGTWLLSKLQASNKRDRLIGFTMNGPHRDDLRFFLNNNPAEQTASRGEIRSIILAYKILETQFIEEVLNQKPLIMFDDVFSELDETRQTKLLTLLKDHQTFITTTHHQNKKPILIDLGMK